MKLFDSLKYVFNARWKYLNYNEMNKKSLNRVKLTRKVLYK